MLLRRNSFCVLALFEHPDRGPRILDDPLAGARTRPPCVQHSAFADAVIAAIVARMNSENVTLWDIAGAFTMMGCAATIFSEPDQVALFFEQPAEQRPDTPP